MRVSRSGAPFPRVLSVFKSHISLSCPEADLRVWKPPRTSPQALPSSTGSPAKVFGRMGCGEGNLFPKRFPSPQSFSSLQIFISCLRSCPARKIPPEKRLPPFETTVWGAPRSSSPPGAASCRERRDIRGRRSAGGSSAARSSSPTKKIPGGPGTIRTTRKAGGLLWPYKGLLPAAPKDAGFHVVQAQCPCRLDYPLKGS